MVGGWYPLSAWVNEAAEPVKSEPGAICCDCGVSHEAHEIVGRSGMDWRLRRLCDGRVVKI